MKIEELTFFTPAYNEEAHLEETITKVSRILPKIAQKYEIIIVDDGSKDKTGEIAEKLAQVNKTIRVIHHQPNRGYGAALKSGFYQARYRWITFIDADGQFDFSEITKFFEVQRQTKADLVIGYYLKRQVPLYRIMGSKLLWQPAVYLLFGLKVRDIDCGFKLISKKVIDKVPKLEAERGPFISSELLIKAKQAGFKIAEIGVHHYPRKAGAATGASLKVILSGFSDLFRLRKKLTQNRRQSEDSDHRTER
jgi:glycosyltransferase involved in cell wall biosynthesis